MTSRVGSKRLMSKTDLLTMITPGRNDQPVSVRVAVERGYIALQSLGRQRSFRKTRTDSKHDLKVVWVSDLIDDELGQIKNCFVVITPEHNYILQADSHRMKIEWMQSLSIAISQSLKFRGSYRPTSWSNLDDLDKWLMVRDVEYHYHSHEVYKGALYCGQWNLGMPHIHGRMKWSNGNCYDGEFVNGVFQGSGTMMWLSHPKFRHYTGCWQGGVIEGYGEMVFADQSVYTGWWHMGMRHGHGRMEYRPDGGTYTGGWRLDKRCGYGVMDNMTKSERYLGMWDNDQHHGAGIQVAGNKFQFAGSFVGGERSYNVTRSMRRKSISLVQDSKWESLFHSTAAILEQMTSIAHLDLTELSTPKSVFTDGDSAVAMDFSLSAMDQQDWDHKTSGSSVPDTPLSGCYCCPAVPYSGLEGEENGEGLEQCAVCRIEGFKSVDHPLGLLLNSLTKCFTESYSGIAVHANLLPHAISELCSVTTRIHQLVKKYCPGIITTDEDLLLGRPRTQLSMLMRSRRHKRRRGLVSYYNSDQYQADSSWLYPIILPSIFPTLFTLYREHHTRDDHKIDHVISSLDRRGDEELSGILEIRNELERWKERCSGQETEVVSEPGKGARNSISSESATEDYLATRGNMFSSHLQSATKIFQTFSEYFTPGNKLLCIQEVDKELNQLLFSCDASEKQRNSQRHDDALAGASSLSEQGSVEQYESNKPSDNEQQQSMPVGILTFVIIRSRVKNLHSEIQFIQDFAGSTLLVDKYGSLLTKLKDSYYQLMELRV